MADRSASAVWEGDLFEGRGTVSTGTTDLFAGAPVTWAARTEDAGGKTSPEELLAAAHAACFCMALSNELSQRGNTPARLSVDAVCTFAPGQGVTTMRLTVTADIPGADEAAFRAGLDAAEASCPVSNALRNNVDIQVDGRLA